MCDSSILFRREAEEAAKKRRDRRKEGLEDSAWEIGGTLEEVENGHQERWFYNRNMRHGI